MIHALDRHDAMLDGVVGEFGAAVETLRLHSWPVCTILHRRARGSQYRPVLALGPIASRYGPPYSEHGVRAFFRKQGSPHGIR
jgi:hypothetical protein